MKICFKRNSVEIISMWVSFFGTNMHTSFSYYINSAFNIMNTTSAIKIEIIQSYLHNESNNKNKFKVAFRSADSAH